MEARVQSEKAGFNILDSRFRGNDNGLLYGNDIIGSWLIESERSNDG
jgi:hypothetical protein